MNTRTLALSAVLLSSIGCGGAQSPSREPSQTQAIEASTTPPSASPDANAAVADSHPSTTSEAPASDDVASEEPETTDNAGREQGACAGLYDDDHGIPPASRTALASYFLTGGFGRDMRFEVRADRSINYVGVDREGPRCFRGTVRPEALEAFRTALVRAGACRLPRQTGRPVPDRGPITLAFHLPGLACSARIARGSEADFERLENVYRAFDALGAPVCGRYCQRMLGG